MSSTIRLEVIYQGVLPFIALQIGGIALIWLLPSIATLLPKLVF